MDDCSKLYCKAENILKVAINNREYFFEGEF
jgi:hypothetical protein